MRVNECIQCIGFPCGDVTYQSYSVPSVEMNPQEFSIILISEAAPANPADYYYAEGKPLFRQTTVQAFKDAGAHVTSMQDILDLGVYLTTAVKCEKQDMASKQTPSKCARLSWNKNWHYSLM